MRTFNLLPKMLICILHIILLYHAYFNIYKNIIYENQ
jgi:hypothetical protein